MLNNKVFRLLLLIVCFFLICQGCTYQAWYEGLQEQQRQSCYQSQSQSEIQNCLDKVNSKTYEEYRKEREELIRKP